MELTRTDSSQLLGEPAVVKCGYLSKKGGDRRNWTHRFFVLKELTSAPEKTYGIEYHKDHKNLKKPKGLIPLNKACVVSYSNRKNFCLSIKTETRDYLIQGKNQTDIDEWKHAITGCLSPFGPNTHAQVLNHKKEKGVTLQRYSLSPAALELRRDVIQGLISILHDHLQTMEPVDTILKNLQEESKREGGLISKEEATSIVGNLPSLIHATLQLLFELETVAGEWDTLAVLPPMGELQLSLVNEIRTYLQHLENALITLRKVQQRNSAITPLLIPSNETPTSPRLPRSPRFSTIGPTPPPQDLQQFLLLAAAFVPKYRDMVRLVERNVTDGDPEYQEVRVACMQFDELDLWNACVRLQLDTPDENVVDKTTEILSSISNADAVTRGKFYLMDEPLVWSEVNRPIHCFLLSDLIVCTSEKKLQENGSSKKPKIKVDYLFSFSLSDICVEEIESENAIRISSLELPNRYTTLVSSHQSPLLAALRTLMAVQPQKQLQPQPSPRSVTSLSRTPTPPTVSMAVPQRSSSASSIPHSSNNSSPSSPNSTPPRSISPPISNSPPTDNASLSQRTTEQASKGTPSSPRKVVSVYDINAISEAKQELSPPPTKNPFRFTQAPKQKPRPAKNEFDKPKKGKSTIDEAPQSNLPAAELDEPMFSKSPTLRQRHKLLDLPPPRARTILRVYALHTETTYTIPVSPITLVGSILRTIVSQMRSQLSPASCSEQNRTSVSLASPVNFSKPTLLLPGFDGGDDTYLDEESPIGLYGLVPNMMVELRFTNPLVSITNVSLKHTGDQPMYLQLLVPELQSWRNIAVTPLTTVGKVFEIIKSRIAPYQSKSEKKHCLFIHSRQIIENDRNGNDTTDNTGSYLADFDRALVDYDIHNMDIIEIKRRKVFEFSLWGSSWTGNEGEPSTPSDKKAQNPNNYVCIPLNATVAVLETTLRDRLSHTLKGLIAATIGANASYAVLQYRDNKPATLTSARSLFSYGLKKTDLLEFQLRVNDAKVASLQLSVKYVPKDEACVEGLVLLPGEILLQTIPCVQYFSSLNVISAPAPLYLSNFQFVYFPLDNMATIKLPLSAVYKLEVKSRPVRTQGQNVSLKCIEFFCRDMRTEIFGFTNDAVVDKVLEMCQKLMFHDSMPELFAFSYCGRHAKREGWEVYDALKEYSRIGIPDSSWRITDVNSKYTSCPTYPAYLVVPASFSDEQLKPVFAFRSRGRIPAITWRHPRNNAVLARCSQPLVGLKRSRCVEDEQLINSIRCTARSSNSSEEPALWLLDARPKANAYANTAMGAGFEAASSYTNCAIEFLNIGNIHVMRDCYYKLEAMIHLAWDGDVPKWFSTLEMSHWLDHIKLLLYGTAKLVDLIDVAGQPVVVHCSDGWDRTAQLCSLAQVCLDPYYRTIRGLEVLIEKEWLSFGHKFHQRIGHGNKNHSDDQRSPIFLQFVDALWQIMQQMECAFEYNEDMLITILDALYSCKFGTFLCNSEKERIEHKLQERTVALWSYINSNTHLFTNHVYEPTPNAIRPISETQHLKLWTGYYMRWMQIQKSIVKGEHVLQPQQASDALRTTRTSLKKEMENLKTSNIAMSAEIEALRAELQLLKNSSSPKSHPSTYSTSTTTPAPTPTANTNTHIETKETNENCTAENSYKPPNTSPLIISPRPPAAARSARNSVSRSIAD